MLTEIQIGAVSGTHGLKGEVKVFPTTDDVHRFDTLVGEELDLQLQSGERRRLTLDRARYFKNRPLLTFREIGSIEEAELLKQALIFIERERALPLEEGEYFVGDLVGCEVRSDEGTLLGTIRDVLKTGANDVYVVAGEQGREILIPVIPSSVLEKHPEEGYVLVHLLPWV